MKNRSIRVIRRTEYQEIHIQLIPVQGETPEIFSKEIAEILHKYKAEAIRATFFGRLNEEDNTIKCLADQLSEINFPFSWIEGDNCSGSFINGAYIFAVSGNDVKRLYDKDKVTGSYFQSGEAEFCYLGGLYSDPDLSPTLQTLSILNRAEKILNQVDLHYVNTVRTWLYLDDILDWYNDFNKARNSFFLQHDIFKNLVPASTGIGGKNNRASKLCLELTAIKPKNENFLIEKVISPLQPSAETYGSSFSRAIRYTDNEYSNLTISGTASINPEGKTVNIGDIRKQIELSFTVVRAILESQNFNFRDVTRGYAYCTDKSFSNEFNKYIETNVPDKFAFICSQNTICRKGLLFEIEMDAIKKKK